MRSKHTNARLARKRRAAGQSVPLLIDGLPPLRGASDQYIWAVLKGMEKGGQIKAGLPDYRDIHSELVKAGFPGYGNKQISKSIGRLKTFGYIREMVELAS